MKTVFGSHEEVAHIWAQQSQAEGKASRVFFDGPTIYSYGRHFPMATFIDAVTVLFTTESYSVSTAKHLSFTRRAIPSGVKVYRVKDVTAANHAANIYEMMHEIEELRRKAGKAIKRGDFYRAEAMGRAAELKEFAARFPHVKDPAQKKRLKALTSGDIFSPAAMEAVKEFEAAERKRKAAEQKRLEAEKAEKIEAWKRGEGVYFPAGVDRVFLRIEERDGEKEVVTSRSARVPLDVAKRLWTRINDLPVALPGMSLGHYKVDSFDGNVLVAGCHKIELTEMRRLASVLGW